MSWLVEVTKTCSVAVELVLVASTRKVRFDDSYSARVIETVPVVGVAGGFIVKFAERSELPKVAVMVALVCAETCAVLMVKVADAALGATVTLAGTVAAPLLLVRRMVVEVWTRVFKVTVPVEVPPPVTVLGFNVTDETVTVGVVIPVVFIRTLREWFAPPIAKEMSGLPSPLNSLARMKIPPRLDCGAGTR